MKMKKYRIKIKMIKETTMNHEQESMERALQDIKKVLETSTKDNLNVIFDNEPKFIYKVEVLKGGF